MLHDLFGIDILSIFNTYFDENLIPTNINIYSVLQLFIYPALVLASCKSYAFIRGTTPTPLSHLPLFVPKRSTLCTKPKIQDFTQLTGPEPLTKDE